VGIVKKTRWGIMGPGAIAHRFVQSLQCLDNAELVAVGSRDMGRAQEFGSKYGALRCYGSYEEFVRDADIEVVYIATTHQAHYQCAMMCIEAGKAVLCEKPFTINSKQAQELVDAARKHGVFLMEAMWTRYLPAIVKLRETLKTNVIGEIRMIKADFAYVGNQDPKGRLRNPMLAGGALLDVGVYPLYFAAMVFGTKPEKILTAALIGDTGVDEQCTYTLVYNNGKLAVLSAAVSTHMPDDAYILGTKGYIKIPKFWHAESFEIHVGGEVETINLPYISTGYAHEALEVMNCLAEGKKESRIMPLDETLALTKIMDEIRRQWGLKYPME
jgi:dihydrodiol dehydrogenase / D-xylose 1-dehydrogenase (NADP)